MTADHVRMVEFGVFVEPLADSPGYAGRLVSLAEREGLDIVGVQDHPYQRRFLDTWTLLSYLAARTERIRFFPDVANLPLRPPAVLAKSAASLDLLSGGRIELGLGAGAFWDAIEAMGGERRSPGEAVRALEEAIRVMRLVWSEERSARLDGEFYPLGGMHPGPRPAHEIGIWVGAVGPKMLDLTGRLADGWVPSSSWATPDRLPEFIERIHEGALGAGRSPDDIRCVYNVSGGIGISGDGPFDGSAERWIETLTHLVTEVGVETFIFSPTSEEKDAQIATFATEVVPAVKRAVESAAKERKQR